MRADLLTAVAVYSNPCRWRSRLRNFRNLEEHLLREGVQLVTVEIAYGERPFDLPDSDSILRVRRRSAEMLWHKENQIDLGFAAVADWKYGIWIDGDTHPVHPGWAAEVVQALQLYKIVQVGSELTYIGPHREQICTIPSLLSLYRKQLIKLQLDKNGFCAYDGDDLGWMRQHGYPGGAWAYRRDAFDALGGMLDCCIVGAGDHHMAMGLLELPDPLAAAARSTQPYSAMVLAWRQRAARNIARDVGLVPGTCLHFHHGSTKKRRYPDRWWILQSNGYDPHTDIHYDSQGLLRLTGNKPKLRDDLRLYFEERDEDSTEL